MKYTDIVFDGPPGPQPGRFIEVEDETGKSIQFGKWLQRPDGYWVMRVNETSNRNTLRGRLMAHHSENLKQAIAGGYDSDPIFTDAAMTLARAVSFAVHKSHCKKLSQMPMVQGRTYMMPKDWDDWRNSQPCDCGLEEFLEELG